MRSGPSPTEWEPFGSIATDQEKEAAGAQWLFPVVAAAYERRAFHIGRPWSFEQ